MRKIVIGIIVVLLLGAHAQKRVCKHQPLDPTQLKYASSSGDHHINKRQVAKQPFRVTPYYDETVVQRNETDRGYIEDLVQFSVDYLNRALSVVPTQEPILLTRNCQNDSISLYEFLGFCDMEGCSAVTRCSDEVNIPEEHLAACKVCAANGSCTTVGSDGDGVPTDFLLYVLANDSNCQDLTIAYASHCQLQRNTDRPVAGFTNLCIDVLRTLDIEEARETVVHEIIHALGFSSGLYAFFRDENGNPLTERDDVYGLPPLGYIFGYYAFEPSEKTIVVTNVTHLAYNGEYEVERIFMTTPTVKEEARRYFNCPSLIGMELENLGGDGTRDSHWKKRLVENEGMTGISSVNGVFSRFTLAMLKDTGWYDVDFSVAEPIRFGRCLGCQFTDDSCFTFGLENQPFCLEEDVYFGPPRYQRYYSNTGCTYDRLAYASCNLVNGNNYNPEIFIPKEYQYFSNPSFGGDDDTLDYCPYYRGGANCQLPSLQPDSDVDVFAEVYGPNSKCIDTEIDSPWSFMGNATDPIESGACYQVYCVDNKVIINIKGENQTCEDTITFEQTSSTFQATVVIKCPLYEDMCWEQFESCKTDHGNVASLCLPVLWVLLSLLLVLHL